MYLRISLDHTGEMLAVERQREDCARIIESRGWTLAGEYVDAMTASDARKARPGYDALVRAWEAGAFDALVCYDLDRLTRQPRQLEDWIDRAEDRDLILVTANGEADLATDGGRMYARIKAAVARAEIERKAARQRRAARQRADKGRPPLGVRLTGYTPKGDVIEDEADVVRRIFGWFAAGESLKSITRLLAADGVRTRHGKPWNPSSVRSILVNPRYAGRAVYQGQETGERGGWEPLVSDDEFTLVLARLRDPRRVSNRHGTDRKYLGAGIYRCTCGEAMRSFSGQRYRCGNGCYSRSMRDVDALVVGMIEARLARPDLADLLARSTGDVTAPLREEVTRLRARIARIAADYDEEMIDGPRYKTATAKAETELAAVETRLAALTSGNDLADVLHSPDPVAAFRDRSLMGKRAVIDALCTVTLHPAPQGRKTFDPSSVIVEPRQP